MKQEYSKPMLEVIGQLRDVTAASHGGLISDLIHGIRDLLDPITGSY